MHMRDAAKNTVQIMGAPFLHRTNGSSKRNPAINFNPEDSHNPGVRNKSLVTIHGLTESHFKRSIRGSA